MRRKIYSKINNSKKGSQFFSDFFSDFFSASLSITLSLGLSLATITQANSHHESDLTNSRNQFDIWSIAPQTELRPSGQDTHNADFFQLEILRQWKDGWAQIPGLTLTLSNGQTVKLGNDGRFRSPAFCSGKISATVQFETPFFAIGVHGWSGGENYRLKFEVPCVGQSKIWADKATPLANVLAIWTVAYTAQEKINAAVGMGFWNRKIPFNYPADGAFYDGTTVNVPNGEEWDVVGHELGHAIFDLGNIGYMAGGEHYIDRCYSETLALSEGWASYFSAFVSVALNDADAKFEFMVPRRAPLRFETIPADVCNGYGNEWRVTGFLWDIIDINEDREVLSEQFASAWNLTSGKMARSLAEVRDSLIAGGFNSAETDQIWRNNTSGGSGPNPFHFPNQPAFPDFQFFDDFLKNGI